MRFTCGLIFLFTVLTAAHIVTISAARLDQARNVDDFQALTIEALRKAGTGCDPNECTLEKARVRRDWEKLSNTERKEYITAVNCLWDLPNLNPTFSAAQNYFDEFVAAHVNLTDYIDGTGNFLTWHRYLIHLWEETLRDQCGYSGALPYWNWFKYKDNLWDSPPFDGSVTSLGGDGDFFAHNGSLTGAGQVYLPSGKGGGCVKSGPFANRVINIGPIRPAMQDFVPVMKNQLDYNPRCLRRDLTIAAAARFTDQALFDVLAGNHSSSIAAFQDEFQSPPGTLRLHGAGHFSMCGDASDVFSSLNDPAFYQHHALVNRVYWMWQALHPDLARTIAGTRTIRNTPPSPNATIHDPLDVGVLGEHLPIEDVLDTLGDTPLCYIYE
ncbi:Di-copper centre-containing protein [Setomelanomma holmii]|uniref:Di-copper centre-containing protein n=1 Tax=Setomelanomma holmii TaxID=210430 RepID=A0A9P4H2P0_9PLEO|nr:Di-copper centre-containing protein [Setomelanomma holmii]